MCDKNICEKNHNHNHREEESLNISCSCSSCHNHSCNEKEESHNEIIKIIFASIFFTGGIILGFLWKIPEGWPCNLLGWTRFTFMVVSFLISGGKVVFQALKNILHGKIFDENFLMSIASVGAFILGEYPEAAAVMLFYQIGEYFQDYAVGKSRRSIASLMKLCPDTARVIVDSNSTIVPAENVVVGSIIEVLPGERIPIDGIVISGSSFLDTSALTGESVPRKINEGEEVLAGCINVNGMLRIETIRSVGDSAITRVLDLVEKSGNKKSVSEQFITRFAKIYTPIVTIASILLAFLPPLILGSDWHIWIERALIFLVVSCPCALVISVPLGFFGGIGAASRKGILVKGSSFLESLANTKTAIFDKTGTLTKGVFKVTKVYVEKDANISETDLVSIAAHAEKYSNHPISISLKNAHTVHKKIDNLEENDCCNQILLQGMTEISGQGIKGLLDGKIVLVGNATLMKNEKVEKFEVVNQSEEKSLENYGSKENGTLIYIALDGKYLGYIIISDEIKEDANLMIKELKKLGINKTIMLTGDTEYSAKYIAKEIGVDCFYSDLMPNDKVLKVEDILENLSFKKNPHKNRVLFVGDGINDAPVLARCDIGMAMGALGSDAAIEASDIVLMSDELIKIPQAIMIAKKTRNIVTQNIVFALGVKGLVLLLGAVGIASMWFAVFADVGVACLAVMNSMRQLFVKK